MSKATCYGPKCERPVLAKGLCNACYLRLRATGTLERRPRRNVPAIERMLARVERRENGCLIWLGRYGRVRLWTHPWRRWQADRHSSLGVDGGEWTCHPRRHVRPPLLRHPAVLRTFTPPRWHASGKRAGHDDEGSVGRTTARRRQPQVETD